MKKICNKKGIYSNKGKIKKPQVLAFVFIKGRH